MDRFIDGVLSNVSTVIGILKSNMDRFIVQVCRYNQLRYSILKSNMDRFIAVQKYNLLDKQIF